MIIRELSVNLLGCFSSVLSCWELMLVEEYEAPTGCYCYPAELKIRVSVYLSISVEELKLTRKVDGVVVCFILAFSEINFKVLKRQEKDESPE